MTLISADNSIALMAALFVIAGGAFLAERTRIGSHLTGAVMGVLLAFVFPSLGSMIGTYVGGAEIISNLF